MIAVEPIRDMNKVCEIEENLAALDTPRGRRMYLLFLCGIYLGLRVSDLLKLRVGDLRGPTLRTKEKKTRKATELPINDALRRAVRDRLADKADADFVFTSRQRDRHGKPKPITRRTAYNDIKQITAEVGLNIPIGCHTLRKTFGYHMYKLNGDIAFLMDWFNHSTPDITKRYIGINLDERRKQVNRLRYRRTN